jgi:glycerol kinase
MQIQADLSGARVLRSADVEATARGAAALAGLAAGLWPAATEARALRSPPLAFDPAASSGYRDRRMAGWREAVARVRGGPAPEAAPGRIAIS